MYKQIVWIALLLSITSHLACLSPADDDFDMSGSSQKTLVVNEVLVRSSDGSNDWIELYNAGENAVYLRDYGLVDDNIDRKPVSLPDIILEPGRFIVIQATDEAVEDGSFYVPFRLGDDDSIALYWGLTIIDILDWKAGDAPEGYSYGRFPDGIGRACTLLPTKNMLNKKIFGSDLVINEIVAQPVDGGSDWIELYNIGEEAVYMGDFAIVDDNPAHNPVSLPDMSLYPGEFIIILATDEPPGDGSFYVPFGLGPADSLTLYQGTDSMDVLDWENNDAPEEYSYGRLPDGSKTTQTLIPSPGQPNKSVIPSTEMINR